MVNTVSGIQEFNNTISSDKVTIIDFTATWCGPCRVIGPVFEKLAEEYGDKATFLKIDVDQEEAITQECGVRAMPTFMVFKGSEKLDSFSGADKNALEALVKKHVV